MREQRLAAILFSDLAGYTRLMGEDKDRALEVLAKARQLHQASIIEHGGELLKELGDGFLASFPSAKEACSCAVELMSLANKDPDIKLHVGVHLGEVIFENEDVFGEGVNIASRIEAVAEEGIILVSESIYLNIRNEKSLVTRYYGSFALKNVSGSIKLYQLAAKGEKFRNRPFHFRINTLIRVLALLLLFTAGWFVIDRFLINSIKEETNEVVIAVMPFQNLGNDPDQDFFSEGLAYEIRSKLAEVRNFRVRSAQSSISFRGIRASLKEIGDHLDVTHILDGSIQRFDNQFHFNLFLNDVKNDESIPINVDDYPDENLYLAQTRIALEVADALSESLSEEVRHRIERVPTRNVEAHRFYLQGISDLYGGVHSSYSKSAEENLLRAITLDSSYAEAYDALAFNYLAKSFNGYMAPSLAYVKIRELAAKVIELDPGSTNAQLAQGLCYFTEYKPREAEHELVQAMVKDPGNHEIFSRLSMVYQRWDEYDKMQVALKKAYELNPLSHISRVNYFTSYFWIGKQDSAIFYLQNELKVNPTNSFAKWMLGAGYLAMDSLNQAIELLKTREVDSLNNNWALGYAYALKGNKDEARRILRHLEKKYDISYLPPTQIGMIYWGLGEKEKSMEWMEKGYEQKDNFPKMVLIFKPLKNEPWFRKWFDLGTLDSPRNPYVKAFIQVSKRPNKQ